MTHSILPFRSEGEKTFLGSIHPVVRFLLPFVFVIPLLVLMDIYLTITIILSTLIFILIFNLKIIRILSRIKHIIPFTVLITIFLPFYVGNTIVLRFNFVIEIRIYLEGIEAAISLFLKILGASFVFLSYYSSLTYSEFIEALTKLRLPSMFVGSLIITLHYIPILAKSNKIILEAQEMRGKKITSYWSKLKTHGYIMGKSLVSNMERSETIYESMKMRGYSGKVTFKSKKFNYLDMIAIFVAIGLLITLIYIIDLEFIYLKVISLFTL